MQSGAIRELLRFRISGIDVPKHSDSGIAGHDALGPSRRVVGAVHDGHLTGMLRVANSDAASVMHRDPTGAGRGVQKRVENGPVGDRVAAVAHAFRFTVRRSDGAAVEMIAANHNRRGDLAFRYKAIHFERQLVTLTITEPADASGQTLELHALARKFD